MSTEAAAYFPDALASTSELSGSSVRRHAEVPNATDSTVELSERSAKAPVLISEIPDEVLMQQLCQGSKESFSVLFRRYARLVRVVAYRILRDASEADDLVQEVFLFIYRKGNLFDSQRGNARSWIVQVAFTQAIDRRRYLATRHFYSSLELSETAIPMPSRSVFYDESIEGVLGGERLRKIADSLSGDQRRVLELYFYEGYTLEEVAKEMMQTVGNIRNHYYRGLERIRRQIFEAK